MSPEKGDNLFTEDRGYILEADPRGKDRDLIMRFLFKVCLRLGG